MPSMICSSSGVPSVTRDERLRLAAREEHRAVLARDEVRHDRDLADLVVRAAVERACPARIISRSTLGVELAERGLDGLRARGQLLVVGDAGRQAARRTRRGPRRSRRARSCLPGVKITSSSARRVKRATASRERLVLRGRRRTPCAACRPWRASSSISAAISRITSLAELERVDHLVLGELACAAASTMQMPSLWPATTRSRRDSVAPALVGRERRRARRRGGRCARRPASPSNGMPRDAHAPRSAAIIASDVGVVHAVVAQHVAHHLDFLAEALGEQRPDRAVDQAHGQDLLGRRAPFALEEAAGDLARGLGLLAVVDGQREEVEVLAARADVTTAAKALVLAQRRDHAAVRLAGDLAGLEDQRHAGDLALDAHAVSDVIVYLLPRELSACVTLVFHLSLRLRPSRARAGPPAPPRATRRERRRRAGAASSARGRIGRERAHQRAQPEALRSSAW